MPKFRRKPVVIEAEQYWNYTGDNLPGVCKCPQELNRIGPHIHTLEGPLRISHGDWIITGVNGERWPCRSDIFAKTYEPAEDD